MRDKYHQILTIRVTNEEASIIKANAAKSGHSLSSFMRFLGVSGITFKPELKKRPYRRKEQPIEVKAYRSSRENFEQRKAS